MLMTDKTTMMMASEATILVTSEANPKVDRGCVTSVMVLNNNMEYYLFNPRIKDRHSICVCLILSGQRKTSIYTRQSLTLLALGKAPKTPY